MLSRSCCAMTFVSILQFMFSSVIGQQLLILVLSFFLQMGHIHLSAKLEFCLSPQVYISQKTCIRILVMSKVGLFWLCLSIWCWSRIFHNSQGQPSILVAVLFFTFLSAFWTWSLVAVWLIGECSGSSNFCGAGIISSACSISIGCFPLFWVVMFWFCRLLWQFFTSSAILGNFHLQWKVLSWVV